MLLESSLVRGRAGWIAGCCSAVAAVLMITVAGCDMDGGAGGSSVTGTVLAGDTGEPLEGVVVSLGSRSAESDGQGQFLFTAVAAGTYDMVLDGTAIQTDQGRYDELTSTVTVGQNETLTIGEPFLLPFIPGSGMGGASLSGFVLGADSDAPLAGVRVSLDDATTETGTDGRFALGGLNAGEYKLRLDGTGIENVQGHYGEFQTTLSLSTDEERDVTLPFYLPFLYSDLFVSVSDLQTTIVNSGNGAVLEIPPGSVTRDGEVYTGEICVCVLPINRTPSSIPDRFRNQLATVVTIQPAGLRFTTPARLTMTNDFPLSGGSLRSLWSLDHDTGIFVNAGVGRAEGSITETVNGGVRESSWHFFTDYEIKLLKEAGFDPDCLAQVGTDFARNCLTSWFGLLGKGAEIAAGTPPGAAPVVSRFRVILENGLGGAAVSEVERVAATINGRITDGALNQMTVVELYEGGRISAKQVKGYISKVVSPPLLSTFRGYARDAQKTAGDCDYLRSCKESDPSKSRVAAQTSEDVPLHEIIDEALEIVDGNLSKFEALEIAYDELAPFFSDDTVISESTLPFWQAGVAQFVEATEAFEQFESPMQAYEVFIQKLDEAEHRIMTAIDEITSADQGDARVVMACGAQFEDISVGFDGNATVSVQVDMDGEPIGSPCVLVALDESSGTCSSPISTSALVDGIASPATLSLDRNIETFALTGIDGITGTLTAAAPVHIWSGDNWHLEGDRILTDAAVDSTYLSRLVMAVGDGNSRLEFFAKPPTVAEGVSYSLDGQIFSFGDQVPLSFEAEGQTRFVFLKDGPGTILVQKIDNQGLLYHELLDSEGNEIARSRFSNLFEGKGNETYALGGGEVYTLVFDHLGTDAAEYIAIVHDVPSVPEPAVISLSADVAAELVQPGETLTFSFEAVAGEPLRVFGLEIDDWFNMAVQTTITDPEGETVIVDHVLEFEGFDFEPFYTFTPAISGAYSIAFRLALGGELVGSFTFRTETAN